MANQEHVDRLRRSVDEWNQWRKENTAIYPDLSGADLRRANLFSTNLSRTNLNRTNLFSTSLIHANMRDADLSGADMRDANLSGVDLSGADLSGADLSDAILRDAILSGARVSDTQLNNTFFAKIDLRSVKGLSTIKHQGPSNIELFSIQLPQDGSALHFLRGIGVPDEWIDYWRTSNIAPIQYHSCFISYCSADELLAKRLHADLQSSGVRCWFAKEDMKIGNKIRERIDQAIYLQDKLLLLLSENSVASEWVETEVEIALEKERRQQREVLFPVRIDESVMGTRQPWARHLRLKRHIGDFTHWTDPQAYNVAFERLLRDLKQGTE